MFGVRSLSLSASSVRLFFGLQETDAAQGGARRSLVWKLSKLCHCLRWLGSCVLRLDLQFLAQAFALSVCGAVFYAKMGFCAFSLQVILILEKICAITLEGLLSSAGFRRLGIFSLMKLLYLFSQFQEKLNFCWICIVCVSCDSRGTFKLGFLISSWTKN